MARPKSAEARRRALDAAVEVLVNDGVNGFTIDAVAQRSGVAKTTIYRNWSSVDDLLFETLNLVIEPEPEPDTGSFRGDLLSLVDHLVSVPVEERRARRQLFSGLFAASVNDPRLTETFDRMVASRCRPVETLVERAKARGELAAHVDTELVTQMFVGPVMFRLLFRDDTFSRQELENLIDYGLGGLVNQD